jgi:hypothetical protein
MPTPLCLLARKYGSDKCSSKHSYTEFYYNEFKDRRESVLKVVELGVGEGASLRMWREFFPNAHILGGDNDRGRMMRDERITVMPCDQSNHTDLMMFANWIGPNVDLFIDDGSHDPVHQHLTCRTLMPQLDPGVVYVIEDVVEDELGFDTYEGYPASVPALPHRRRYDNHLIVVRHAAN